MVAEGIQTVLRREGYPKPYEALKALTRTNQTVTEQSIKEFIETLNVSDRIKDELRAITLIIIQEFSDNTGSREATKFLTIV